MSHHPTPTSHAGTRGRGRRLVLGLAIAAIAVVSGCGGSDSILDPTGTVEPTDTTVFTDTTDTTGTDTTDALAWPPTTYAQAEEQLSTGTVVRVSGNRFTAGDTDIFCTVEDDPALTACELSDSRLPPPTDHCTGSDTPTDVGRIEFDGTTPLPVCNSDTIRGETAETTQPGDIVESADGDRRCLTAEVGVICVDVTAGTGFALSNSEYTTFPY